MSFRFRRTRYDRGREFEYRVRDYLIEEMAALYVIRSAGSKGIFDLVAAFEPCFKIDFEGATILVPVVLGVQCKRDGRLSKDEREELALLGAATGMQPVIAKRGDRGEVVVEPIEGVR